MMIKVGRQQGNMFGLIMDGNQARARFLGCGQRPSEAGRHWPVKGTSKPSRSLMLMTQKGIWAPCIGIRYLFVDCSPEDDAMDMATPLNVTAAFGMPVEQLGTEP